MSETLPLALSHLGWLALDLGTTGTVLWAHNGA